MGSGSKNGPIVTIFNSNRFYVKASVCAKFHENIFKVVSGNLKGRRTDGQKMSNKCFINLNRRAKNYKIWPIMLEVPQIKMWACLLSDWSHFLHKANYTNAQCFH